MSGEKPLFRDHRPNGSVPADTVVAIDGPAGSGKSTTARALADRFGLTYVDTGAMYRALTCVAAESGVDPDDGPGLVALLGDADLRLRSGRETAVFWNGRDLSDAIRTPAVEASVSAVSSHAEVRRLMVGRQRQFARESGVVMEGRDIGSVVFPLASAKIYLDASLEARVERRHRQHRRRGITVERGRVEAELIERDRYDSQRSESPLTVAPDALVIDNSRLGLQEQLDITADAILQVLDEQAPPPAPPRESPALKYRIAYGIFTALGRSMGLRIIGREHLFRPEPLIYACNHVSMWDPPMIGSALAGRGRIRSVAKEELFATPVFGRVYDILDAIPIKRSIYDQTAFDAVEREVAEGWNVLFFPEGMRRPLGRPGPVRNGLGMVMQRTGAAAVPMFVRGTSRPRPGGSDDAPLEVRIAPPVRLRALPVLRRTLSERQISTRIARLFEHIYLELQARSTAEHPFSEQELEIGRRQVKVCRRKEARIFRRRPTRDGAED